MNKTIRVCVLGDACVGKTSILRRICQHKFSINESPTIGLDIFFKKIIIENNMVTIQFWDTAGAERFSVYNRGFYKKSDLFLFVFDVTNRQSFYKLNDILLSVRNESERKKPIILIGTKGDTLNREVTDDEINNFCNNSIWCVFYAELSSKKGFDSDAIIKYIYNEGIISQQLANVQITSHEQPTISVTTTTDEAKKNQTDEYCVIQ